MSSWQEHPSILFYLSCRCFLCASYSRFHWKSSSDKLRQESGRVVAFGKTPGVLCGGSLRAQRSCLGYLTQLWEHQHGKMLFLLIAVITDMRWWDCTNMQVYTVFAWQKNGISVSFSGLYRFQLRVTSISLTKWAFICHLWSDQWHSKLIQSLPVCSN